jgi:hypothetical protein
MAGILVVMEPIEKIIGLVIVRFERFSRVLLASIELRILKEALVALEKLGILG